MLFMCRETGELYEVLILALEDHEGLWFMHGDPKVRAWPIGKFTLFGSGAPRHCLNSELHLRFEFLGII